MRSLKAISNCRGSDVVTSLVRIRLRFKLTLQELIQQILALCSISIPSENVRKPLVYNVFRGDRNGILS